ncbi:hypothetical protein CRENBAI_017668 [Crenichthys baileyi]|uniref:Cadherin domain-containing protein n=1 Tax=Crenichthys baileyi TaxID=28760 RepID=A0AAV9RJ13_9TELE
MLEVTMEQRKRVPGRLRRYLAGCVVAMHLWCAVSAQLRYSISEEVNVGTMVGNIAKDLGLDKTTLKERKYRIVSSDADPIFHANPNDGILYVSRKIDREEVCSQSSACVLNVKTVLENPLEVHYVRVEVLDINDHSPTFQDNEITLEISESVFPGARFQLKAARDPDSGHFSVQHYKLNQNEHFRLEVKDKGDDGKIPVLIVQKPLDRETAGRHSLVLTALDGGKPPKTGSMNIRIDILDVNDNVPVFFSDAYSVSLRENVPLGTTVVQVNATDLDEGTNGEVIYSLGKSMNQHTLKLFDINSITGEITVKGLIDYEERDKYEIEIEASDKGFAPLTTEKSVTIKIIDVNDNAPEIEVTSFSSSIPEDSRPGTTVALISVNDLDSGLNGKVICSMSEDIPFTLSPTIQDTIYSLITQSLLDREKQSHYDLTIFAKDAGHPRLSSEKTISVVVSDVNDNSPEFVLSPYNFYLTEANEPGTSVFSVKAFDHDDNENALLSYQIVRDGSENNKLTSFLNINSETGDIVALKSFDFETLKTFQFQVVASDSGSPSLSSNVTVNVFILDQNDNAPVILYPVSSNGSAEGVEEIPRNVNVGHLVTKVRAYDADIGYNGWLLFSLQEVTDHSLFGLDRYTGQIRTLRSFTETDEAEHKLVILVKDNGNVSLSATATVIVKLVEPKEAFAASDVKSAAKDDEDNNVTFYLMITLGSVSVLFIISIIVLSAMQCSKSTDYTSKYLPETNYDGTLCHSIQYRSGDKRYMLVGPRMSIGSTIVPGSHANTLVLPDRRTSEEVMFSSVFCLFVLGRIMNTVIAEEIRMEQRGYKQRQEQGYLIGFVLGVLLWSVASAQLRYSVFEEVKEGTVVGNIAKDLGIDKSILKDRKYRIVSGDVDPLFNVNQNDGILHVNRKIDKEEVCAHNSRCVMNVKTVLENPLEVHYVEVEILDINDHSPVFSDKDIILEISESALPGARFQLKPAQDPDSGDITVKGVIDYEDKDEYEIEIQASDKGFAPLRTEKSVIVKIIDMNDNAPEIEVTSFSSSIPEDSRPGTTVALISVNDLDSGLNGKTVSVVVSDVNDNNPEFLLSPYTFYVTEGNDAGSLMFSVKATDRDENENARISYQIVREGSEDHKLNSYLNINSEIGDIVALKSFDFETLKTFQFQVVASDSGSPSLSSNVTVNVFILDQNDNAPVILYPVSSNGSAEGVEEIPRNVNAGHLVTKVRAYDADIGYNGWLLFSLQEVTDHSLFGLDRYTGQIRTLRSFTETDEAEHKLVILVKDNGNVSLSATATVIVKLVEPKEAFAASDVKSAAKDDEDNNVTFYLMITLGSVSVLFIISIIVLIAMQCSKSTDYTSKYLPETNYDGTLCHSIQYRSGDKRYMLVGPRMSIGSTIVPGSHANTLVLPDRRRASQENDGVLYVSRKIDREEVCGQSTSCLINLKTVLENPLEIHYVGVEVMDINDHSPSFQDKEIMMEISESASPGVRIPLPPARDPDVGSFAVQQYKVSANDHFRLEVKDKGQDGEIIVKGIIDFEERDKYEIEIQASDKGSAPLSTQKSVNIKIVDVNDNAPEIEVTSFSRLITEDSRPGTTVALISVNDLDSGLNGKVLCSISEDFPFALTPSSRDKMFSLVTNSPLDKEKQSQYVITVRAKDAGEPSLSSEKLINVVVSDVNDNSPEFLLSPYNFYIAEGNNPGSPVFSVKAFDQDDNENARISYHIIRNGINDSKLTSFLNVNSETGEIVALQCFDFETLKTFQFQVVASDSGSPSLSSNVTVNVFILDQNDNAPVILYPVSSNGSAEGVEEIPRNVNAGHLVTKVRAYDADIGYNGWLLFSLQEVTDHSLFGLDRYTGQIRTLRSFTETDEAEHKLVILVKDNGNVSLSATATVIVKLVEPKEAFAASDVKSAAKDDEDNNVTFYLMITLGSVSVLFIISIIVLIAMQCSKSTDYTSKYLPETNYDGTLCHSIQYRSGDKRYMLVGPRMSIGSTIVPGSHANTLVLPDRRRTCEEVS